MPEYKWCQIVSKCYDGTQIKVKDLENKIKKIVIIARPKV